MEAEAVAVGLSQGFWKGSKPIADTCWLVETVRKGRFVRIGKVSVSGRRVKREMVAHRSIKGYEPVEIAEKIAKRRFPKAESLVLTKIRCPKR